MSSPVPQPKRYAARIDRVAPRFADLPCEVQQLIRLCDGTRSLAQLRAGSGLPPRTFERVMRKLHALELISVMESERLDRERALAWARTPSRPRSTIPPAAMSSDPMPGVRTEAVVPPRIEVPPACPIPIGVVHAFSHDEEAFFARSIEHLLEAEERQLTIA